MPFIPNTPESLLPRSDSKNPASTCRGLTSSGRPCRRPTKSYCWQHEDQAQQIKKRSSVDTLAERFGLLDIKRRKPTKKPKQSRSTLMILCCVGEADEETRPTKAARPRIHRGPSSRELLSLIPSSLPPQTTSLLLAELAKPASQHDEEGFIYMFWLTPESLSRTPPSETASSLLEPPRPEGQRRTSDVLNSFADTSKKTILLKIGRAQNVQRRLNQWTRQCGYNVSLIRYYPYHTSKTPRKVPIVHKVERLIHIELSRKRAQGSGKCSACDREHREWFEVAATREAVKAVDTVIRRWVDWGEGVTKTAKAG